MTDLGPLLDSLLSIAPTLPEGAQITVTTVLYRLFSALGLGMPLAWLFNVTNREKGTKSSFMRTLHLLPFIAAVVILVIGNNLVRAFGLLGAVSLVRFRTVVKNILDMAFVFMAITLGMACGTGLVAVAVLALLMFSLALGTMELFRYGRGDNKSRAFMLSVKTDDIGETNAWIERSMEEIVLSSRLREIVRGDPSQLTYRMVLAKGVGEAELIDRIERMQGPATGRVQLKRV
jgi:uncharacterized membrane protein YhiD involved in acid resistance